MFTSFKKLLLGTLLVFMTVDLGVCSEAYSGNNIIEIHTADDLIKLAEQSNLSEGADNFTGKTVRFMNDIDMKNKPFDGIATGDEFKMFKGRLDGNHKTIKGLKIDKPSIDNVGLIGRLGNGGSIDNLTIAKGSIKGRTNVGAFVGGVAKDATVTIKGVTNHATVTGTDRSIGGLVGYNGAGAITIANSSNIGAVTGVDYVGGLVGLSESGSTITISNSSNIGNIEGSFCVGGIVGTININRVGDRHGAITISNSSNIGNIEGESNVGGLVGAGSGTTITISNSSNIGNVIGDDFVGGFVGFSNTRATLTIANSSNIGNVTGVTIGDYVGGLIGLSRDALTIDNSSNIGDITGTNQVGGLVGSSGGATITNSHSYAKIVRGSSNVGGIVGEIVLDTTFTVNNVYWLYEAEGTGIKLAVGEMGLKGDYNPNSNTSKLNKRAFKKKGSFKGWDIKKVWELKKGAEYPTLKNLVIPVVTP